ncbi:MAG: hypothetical protein IK083_09425 [Abditibacteriota bacterium]|nr:hypothetical protein [Abditibacteriota bacterium]
MKKLTAVLLVCLASCCLLAQDAPQEADLKLIFNVGQTAEYDTETSLLVGDITINGMSMPMPQQAVKMTGQIKQTCVAKDKSGFGTVCTSSVMSAGEGTQPFRSYIKSLESPRGKTVKLIEMEVDGKKTDFTKEKNQLAGATLSQILNQSGYPEKPVKVGEGWKFTCVKSDKNPFTCDLLYVLETVAEINGDRVAKVVCSGTIDVSLEEAVRLFGSSSSVMQGDLMAGMNGTARITVEKAVTDINLTKGVLQDEAMKCALTVNIADETSGLSMGMNAAMETVTQLKSLSSK